MKRYALFALGYMGFLWFLSGRPDSLIPLPSHSDKIAHLAAYIPLGYSLTRGLGRGRRRAALLLAFAYGVMDEVHQSFVPGRLPSAVDVLADLAGSSLGMVAARRREDVAAVRNPAV